MPNGTEQQAQDVILEFNDGDLIKVPDTLAQATPYILREQGRWFEKEVDFVDQYLQPGMRVIDIGANFGVYTLAMAKRIGPEGALYAFEPSSKTAAYLRESLKANDLENVTLLQQGLADRPGKAKLALNNSSELNRIEEAPESDFEEIAITTLDAFHEEVEQGNVDFVKLDAEGYEAKVIAGGVAFLKTCSPLVMFEIIHNTVVNSDLVERFMDRGYRAYRHVEGLNFLVPFTLGDEHDPYELNLFCCKEDKAQELQKRGLLVTPATLAAQQSLVVPDDWYTLYAGMPFYSLLYGDRHPEEIIRERGAPQEYLFAMQLMSVALSESARPEERYVALQHAVTLLVELADTPEPHPSHIATLSRAYWALGMRQKELAVLNQSIEAYKTREHYEFNEPFLPVCPRYDRVDPGSGEKFFDWIRAQIIEQIEVRRTFSSYDSGESGLMNVGIIEQAGFADDAIRRRGALIRERFQIP